MNDILCGYPGDREAALISYVYDELSAGDRAAFDAHLATCARCRTELNAFGTVRRQLARWTPPVFAGIGERVASAPPPAGEPPAARANVVWTGDAWWRAVPIWARAAAAVLVLGAAAGMANLDVHYDAQGGLNLHTGWSKPAAAAASAKDVNANIAQVKADAVSHDELAALAVQLRAELRAAHESTLTTAAAPAGASNGTEVLRQVRALLEQSERRQQTELALRVAALSNEMNVARQADLRKIDMNLGRFQDSTGVEVLRNRQKLDYLLQRASQQQQ